MEQGTLDSITRVHACVINLLVLRPIYESFKIAVFFVYTYNQKLVIYDQIMKYTSYKYLMTFWNRNVWMFGK